MKTITFEVQKFVFTKEEKELIKTWGSDWKRIIAYYKKHNCIFLQVGTWSGYKPEQRRIVHCTFDPHPIVGTIEYTDHTTLEVTSVCVTFEYLFAASYTKRDSYSKLISKLRAYNKQTGSSYYRIK